MQGASQAPIEDEDLTRAGCHADGRRFLNSEVPMSQHVPRRNSDRSDRGAIHEIVDALDQIEEYASEHENEAIHQKIVLKLRDLCVLLGYSDTYSVSVDEREVGKDRADVKAFDDLGYCPFAFEVKNPYERIGRASSRREMESQLRKYVNPERTTSPPEILVLTDGVRVFVYTPKDNRLGRAQGPLRPRELADVLFGRRREALDIYDREKVASRLSPPNRAKLASKEAIQAFCDEFGLAKVHGVFGDLLFATIGLFKELGMHSTFLKGAYSWWGAHYFAEVERVPRLWAPYVEELKSSSDYGNDQELLRVFMFALETAYTFLARFIFFKALRDHGLEDVDSAITQAIHRSDSTYLKLTRVLMETYQKGEVENIFEADIFDWWTDAIESSISTEARRRFDASLARLLLSIWRYHFVDLKGDLVGDLYQTYFDRDVRKALGEFYTPEEVVDFILDQIGYSGEHPMEVAASRFLDPACGSGTFLVHALRRYLESHKNKVLATRKLFTTFPIVGFDIHPFACLMSQLNFLLTILPYYAKARQSKTFRPKRMPIFRTDTLWKEPAAWNGTLDRTTEADVVVADISLPVLVDAASFARIRVELPTPAAFDRVCGLGELKYIEFLVALFTALKQFDLRTPQPPFDGIVKSVSKRVEQEYAERYGRLKLYTDTQTEGAHAFRGMIDRIWNALASEAPDIRLKLGLSLTESLRDAGFEGAESLAESYVAVAGKILVNVRLLRNEFHDGRYVKAIEDYAIATVLKHYVKYDFVAANPPYVRFQRLQHLSGYLAHYREVARYKAMEGAFDISVLFVERGMEFLSTSGKMGYITSDTFMKADFGAGIRQEITRQRQAGVLSVSALFDLGYTRVFDDVMNHPCVLFVSRMRDQPPPPVLASRVTAADRMILPIITRGITRLPDRYFLDPAGQYDLFVLRPDVLDAGPWLLLPDDERMIAVQMRREGRPLEKHASIVGLSGDDIGFEGPRTGNNDVFFVKKVGEAGTDPRTGKRTWKVISEFAGGTEFEVEADILKPALQGREISRWRLGAGWQQVYVIFPYLTVPTEQGLRVELVPETTMQSQFPMAWEYLTRPAVKRALEARENGSWRGRADWYTFARAQNLERILKPKILSPDVAPRNRFALDAAGGWFVVSAFGMSLPTTIAKDALDFVMGQLNSRPLEFFAKAHGEIRAEKSLPGRTTYNHKYDKGLLSKFPLLEYNAQDPTHVEIARFSKELSQALSTKFPEDYITGNTQSLTAFVDVPEGIDVGLSDQELEETFQSYQETVDGECRIVLGRWELDFPSAVLARYVRIWLGQHAAVTPRSDRHITSAALARLPVPRRESQLDQALRQYEEADARIHGLQERLDDAVARAYGLADSEYVRQFRDRFGMTPLDVLARFLQRF